MSFPVRDHQAVPAWQERALARSLQDMRQRSVARLSQFVDAARQLAAETGSADFTVQQVVSRSEQSLKTFYRYFEGKDDLIIALIEEDSLVGAGLLSSFVDDHREPLDRLEAFVRGLSIFGSVGEQGYVMVLLREERRLETLVPDRMAAALAPFTDLLCQLLMEYEVSHRGAPANEARCRALTERVFDCVLADLHRCVISGSDESAEARGDAVWEFCRPAIEASGGVAR